MREHECLAQDHCDGHEEEAPGGHREPEHSRQRNLGFRGLDQHDLASDADQDRGRQEDGQRPAHCVKHEPALHGRENDELASAFRFTLHRGPPWGLMSISPLPSTQLDRAGRCSGPGTDAPASGCGLAGASDGHKRRLAVGSTDPRSLLVLDRLPHVLPGLDPSKVGDARGKTGDEERHGDVKQKPRTVFDTRFRGSLKWRGRRESNPQPPDRQSGTLTN